MTSKEKISFIVNWLADYANNAGIKGFVIGVSGGVDSAVTSTLCAMTGKKITVLNMPILQPVSQFDRSNNHIKWLKAKFEEVSSYTTDLTSTFEQIGHDLPKEIQDHLTMANVRARLRMTTLYAYAGHNGYLVVGTGNKIEDFGVGFFTKYGDGGVDLSPIADLTKTEVFELAKELDIIESIQKAKPTDGLWDDDRSDEDQIGASYPELEWAMNYITHDKKEKLTEREEEVLTIYTKLNKANRHKVEPIPVCLLPRT
jgi:NAD+ synthase